MMNQFRRALALAAVAMTVAAPSSAQQRAGLMGELMSDVTEVQSKLVTLARQMPADKYDWRPGTGVRSVGEVMLHVAADNYFLPSAVGFTPPAASGISATDFNTLTAFEKQKLSRDATVASMERSFVFLMKSMADTPDARLDEKVKFFGREMTVRQVWMVTAMHLHEHLGQAIAYARTNGVVPQWSQKGG